MYIQYIQKETVLSKQKSKTHYKDRSVTRGNHTQA